MENFDTVEIANRVEELLKRKPFCADQAKVMRKRDINVFLRSFNDGKIDAKLLNYVGAHLRRCQEGMSVELSNAPRGRRRTIGLVPLGELTVGLLKTEHLSATEKRLDYGIDTYYLSAVKSVTKRVIDTYSMSKAEVTIEWNRWVGLRLLKYVIEPAEALERIIRAAQELPGEAQKKFAELLNETPLEGVVSACKTIVDRLRFLAGLQVILFEPESKVQLRERSQLHRILAKHTWIFGERYNLTVDDQSLTEVLKRHVKLLGRKTIISEQVVRENGAKGIVDLMLARRCGQKEAKDIEYLIIELKRPSVPVSESVVQQIKSYANAVAEDERFKHTNNRWVFWAVSNRMTKAVERDVNQFNRPQGLLYKDTGGKITVWAKTWGQIIESCLSRFDLFKELLNYQADRDSGLSYLKETCAEYLPRNLNEQ